MSSDRAFPTSMREESEWDVLLIETQAPGPSYTIKCEQGMTAADRIRINGARVGLSDGGSLEVEASDWHLDDPIGGPDLGLHTLHITQRHLHDGSLQYPYPEELEAMGRWLLQRAATLYEYNANQQGKGDGWDQGDPRWHFYKAQDEISTATTRWKDRESPWVIGDRLADSLNHQTMALAQVIHDGS